MHNAAFAAHGVDAVYLPLPALDAEDFLAFAQAFEVHGASVTIPFKVPLFERVSKVDAVSRAAGAINTLRRESDGWAGRNTDVAGFLRPLAERQVALRGTRAAVLGAGGSARAAAKALTDGGARVSVHARDQQRGSALADAMGTAHGPWPVEAGGWDLLVNCTPVGMHPLTAESPVPPAALTGRWVYDLVYNPPVTRLLHEAASAGCATIGGLDMLVAQAQEQFAWWTDVTPAASTLRQAALRRLSEFTTDANHVA
jgi:shikimate dehydrogenase